MNRNILLSIILLAAFFLSGCMYPNQERSQNQIPYKDQIQSVQAAVDSYRKDNGGLLPIKTTEANTPVYQKYPIDFKKLTPRYLSEPPGNAFENGGIFQYVIINEQTNPTVKLFDLRIAETIQEIKMRIKANGYPPYKKVLANNVFSLDFTKIGYEKPPYAVSPYTGHNLPFVITGDTEIYVDYSSDLYQALKQQKETIKPGEDIRPLLVSDSMFVPAYSLPYTVDPKTQEPIFLIKK
ncbi:MAG: hypothetical protein Q8935_05570 [Bacillota bacterium]|nr:hypothetical protein [Bacillota bacterium]MDP4156152.1 hypothetical protein [Bacillota bacterium]